MLHPRPNRLAWLLVLEIGLWAESARAHSFRYHYTEIPTPADFRAFRPVTIDNGGVVCGNAFDQDSNSHVAIYANGALTVLQNGFVTAANDSGTIGGSVVIDPNEGYTQAALFHRAALELIPLQQGAVSSQVVTLNNSGAALVSSTDGETETFTLYKNGLTTPVDFGLSFANPFFVRMNAAGTISGTTGAGGFRFDPRTGETTLLAPIPPDPDAWGVDINNRGDVVGYSFVNFGRERIGVFGRNGEFKTYFVEGTPEFPTISNNLLFNDNELIVITSTNDGKNYLVPAPGVRLNIADLVDNLPPAPNAIRIMVAMNNRGSMTGFGFNRGLRGFVLERTGGLE